MREKLVFSLKQFKGDYKRLKDELSHMKQFISSDVKSMQREYSDKLANLVQLISRQPKPTVVVKTDNTVSAET